MILKRTLLCTSLILLGLVSYMVLKLDLNRILFWLNVANKYPNRTSLALLTIVDDKHEVFDISAIPQREIQNEGSIF